MKLKIRNGLCGVSRLLENRFLWFNQKSLRANHKISVTPVTAPAEALLLRGLRVAGARHGAVTGRSPAVTGF
jgi:hypothetical protein